MKNAFGYTIKPLPVTLQEVNALTSVLVDNLKETIDVIMLVGSINEFPLDICTDVDLRIFSKVSKETITKKICKVYKALGAGSDDLRLIHSPFDKLSYIFDNVYVETEIYSIKEITSLINKILSGKADDNGFIHSMQTGKIVYDKLQKLTKLKSKINNLIYTEELTQYCIKKHGAVSLKLLLHAILREDYSATFYWLHRVFLDTTRILFAKNKTFFPGEKRLLTFYIPKLKLQPKGYVRFWNKIFTTQIRDWESIYNKALGYMLQIKGY